MTDQPMEVTGAAVAPVDSVLGTPPALTLDPDRTWFNVTCVATNCGVPAHVENGAGNTVSRPVVVEATLPDGTVVPVQVDQEFPAPTLRWECGACGRIQEVTL